MIPAKLTLLALLLAPSLCAQSSTAPIKPNSNTAPYPLGNPVIRHMYTADAAPHVFPDGRVWMVTSVDRESGGGYETMSEYHTFSSADMVNWTDHGSIFHVDHIRPADAPAADKYALWAPDMLYRNGIYYLYYPVRILHSDKKNDKGGRVTTSYLGIATSDHPTKPFKVVVPRIPGTNGIDPSVFIDDDGQPYLYWGHHKVAKLADDMISLATPQAELPIGTDIFMEAAWMHKRNGKYFFNYHTKYDWQIKITKDNHNSPNRAKSDLDWSVGTSPLGPLTYGGTLNYEPGVNVTDGPRHPDGDFPPWRFTLSNHGGVVEYHGTDYLFYHTSALSSWRQDSFKAEGTWTQRSVCIDRIDYGPDGYPLPVRQTITGVAPVRINQPFSFRPQLPATAKAVTLKQNRITARNGSVLSLSQVPLGTGYYYFRALVLRSPAKARIELRRDRPDGPLLGTLLLDSASPQTNGGKAETFLREARGTCDVHLVFRSDSDGEIEIDAPEFFAGSPLAL